MSGRCGLLTPLMKTLRNFFGQDEKGMKFGWQESLLLEEGHKTV